MSYSNSSSSTPYAAPSKWWPTPFVQRFDQHRRTCNREGRKVLKQYLMSMSSKWWKQVTRIPVSFGTRGILDYVRNRLSDSRPTHQHEN